MKKDKFIGIIFFSLAIIVAGMLIGGVGSPKAENTNLWQHEILPGIYDDTNGVAYLDIINVPLFNKEPLIKFQKDLTDEFYRKLKTWQKKFPQKQIVNITPINGRIITWGNPDAIGGSSKSVAVTSGYMILYK